MSRLIGKEATEFEVTFWEKASPFVLELGLELYEVRFNPVNKLLQVFIFNPENKTATIDECVQVNRELDPIFEEDWIPEGIVLEVSSPGAERALTRDFHFNQAKGTNVKVKYRQESTVTTVKGVLEKYDDENKKITLTLKNESLDIDLSQVTKAEVVL